MAAAGKYRSSRFGKSSLFPSPFHGYPTTIRLVFDEVSPIRDAVLAVNWLDEPVDSIEALIEQAKRNAERNAPYRPA